MAEGNNVIHATIDLWSSSNMELIIGVRFHYFDTEFKLVVKTAAFRHLCTCGKIVIWDLIGILSFENGISGLDLGYEIWNWAMGFGI